MFDQPRRHRGALRPHRLGVLRYWRDDDEPVAGTKVDLFVTFTIKPNRGLPRSRVKLRGAIAGMVDLP